ncbi:TLD domain-containing protein 1 [Choanephora cucurbitarum]|uniref:MTOR-associated protein MEAK7 n=1 Tax=Choanephora cucurbitarum TaxID=101091 RepID=A0A1C7NQQ1_9FUNG|nr:TLD domain-containing protein 1 [Choanephora cucurbitarum]
MGNGHSQESQKRRLWSVEEQEKLNKRFSSANGYILPDYFPKELSELLQTLFEKDDSFELAHQIVKQKQTLAIYLVFRHCVQQQQISLETFVAWIVQVGIPLWFETGSGYPWQPDSKDASQAKALVTYILMHADERERQQRASMAWLDEEQDKEDKEEEERWQTRVKGSPSELTEAEFLHWIEQAPGLRGLFQLTIERFLFDAFVNSKHEYRLNHLISPCLSRHDRETRRLLDNRFSSLLSPFDYFMLTLHLPPDALSWSEHEKDRRKTTGDLEHTLLYSSRRDGTSWQMFANRLVGQGATLIVIKAKQDGFVFGGYADEAWANCNTDWYGNSSNFLFRLARDYGAWRASNNNSHYQYLCWGKKSLPNGLGMGGQFEYAGLWLESDFLHGHSRAGPLCTTFGSPQLSSDQNFLIDEVEGNVLGARSLLDANILLVWLVRPLLRDEDEDMNEGKGVLGHAEDMEFMEMAGKKMYSKDLGPNKADNDDESS